MKTLLSFVVLTIFMLASSFTIDAQQSINDQSTLNCFNFLRLHRQARGIAVSWSTSDPNIVSYVVERSYDELNYHTVNTVASNNASSYKLIDNDIFPGVIYYRVIAVKADGTTDCSPVEKVRIVQRG